MAVTIHWLDDDQHILVMEFIENWTWEELYKTAEKAIEAYESVPHRVDVIYDFRRVSKMPGNILSNAGKITRHLHPNIGIQYVLMTSVVNQAIFDVFNRLYILSTHQHIFLSGNSFEEAVERLTAERKKRE